MNDRTRAATRRASSAKLLSPSPSAIDALRAYAPSAQAFASAARQLDSCEWGHLQQRVTRGDPLLGSLLVAYAVDGVTQAMFWCQRREKLGYRVRLRWLTKFDEQGAVPDVAACYLLNINADNPIAQRIARIYERAGVTVHWWTPTAN
jgi:hypothetical protein